jgi:hypothetical protein
MDIKHELIKCKLAFMIFRGNFAITMTIRWFQKSDNFFDFFDVYLTLIFGKGFLKL